MDILLYFINNIYIINKYITDEGLFNEICRIK